MGWRKSRLLKSQSRNTSGFLFILYCCLLFSLSKAEFHADYFDGDDYQSSSNDGGSIQFSSSNNDEIYEPAILQQEVEKEEHKISLENKSEDYEFMDHDNETHTQINHLNSQENYVVEPMVHEEKDTSNATSNEYEDYEIREHMNTITPRSFALPITSTSSPIKKEISSASDEVLDPNASISEYMDDDSYNSSSEQQEDVKPSSSDIDKLVMEPANSKQRKSSEFIPIPMKYFQARQQLEKEIGMSLESSQNKNKTNLNSKSSEIVSSSEEEYYEDSNEMESKHSATTTKDESNQPFSTSTTTPIVNKVLSQQIPITIAKAALGGGFRLPWPSTTNDPVTTTITPSTKKIKLPSLRALFPNEMKSATMPSLPPEYFQSLATEEPETIYNLQQYTPAATTTTTLSTPTTESPTITTRTTTAFPSTTPPSTASSSLSTTTASPAITSTTFIPPITTTIMVPTTTPITTIRPKQGKQINIVPRRKLSPHEQLHNYIEDAYIRTPLAVIVDPSLECLDKTKTLWNDALHTNLNIKIILVSLNASGIPASYNFNNTRQFLSGLNSIKEHDGGNSFVGILHAAELVPYDSAVYVSTAVIPRHDDLVQDAAITLLKKRIRLYLIWYGEKSLSENETQEATGGILGEVAIRSGGEVLHLVGDKNSQEIEGSTLTLVADALKGSQEVEIPIDTTLSSLHVKIDAPMRQAYLQTPYGDINLKKMVKFKSIYTRFDNDDQRLDAYVPLTKVHRASVYVLKLIPESLEKEYTVFIRAERKSDMLLGELVRRLEQYMANGSTAYPSRYRIKNLPSNKFNPYTLPKSKSITHADLQFPEKSNTELEDNDIDLEEPKSQIETFSNTEIKMDAFSNNFTRFDADIVTVRASNLFQQYGTKIEMGTQSQIIMEPGTTGKLYFEITNLRNEAVGHNIRVDDDKSYLLSLTPQRIFILPDQTAIVTLVVIIPTDVPQGTVDRITLKAQGANGIAATITVNLKIRTKNEIVDNTAPVVTWEYGSRCDHIAVDSSSCGDRFWLLDITAQDWQSGILRLQSNPPGLWYRNSYTVGSSDPVKATYMATCCEPKVLLTVYDAVGNQRSYNVDVRDFVFNEASIAAIVLGSILLLIVIILIIASIVWCCRRRQTTINLPTYRSHSTRSME